ncbi:MAG: V-type ATP synthase subunit B [candidate division WOR-3 bacterium]
MEKLSTKEYQTVSYISGPLLFLEGAKDFSYAALVEIIMPDGTKRKGQVLEVSEKYAVIQVLEGTLGLDVASTKVRFLEDQVHIGVSKELIGRIFNGRGEPIDGLPAPTPEKRLPIVGAAINPIARDKPSDFIQTGISAIDGFNTLVRGQKLPIFSGAGLPANEIAAMIMKYAKVRGEGEEFLIIFAAMGLTSREYAYFMKEFKESGALGRIVAFVNLADDPAVERLLTPRFALTVAEYFAFELDYHVLVILSDMTNYCEALREIGAAREEVPGRRGYPGYMYTDLATMYERTGRIRGKKGSITQIPILTMPDDDITHPIPDLTGYITEGQIVLSRELHRKGIFPPIDILMSLSRLMNLGIGEGKTKSYHREWKDQLYACYARGRDLRRLVAIIGEDALSDIDKKYLKLADEFENVMLNQRDKERSIEETFEIGWNLMGMLPKTELSKIKRKYLEEFYKQWIPQQAKEAY